MSGKKVKKRERDILETFLMKSFTEAGETVRLTVAGQNRKDEREPDNNYKNRDINYENREDNIETSKNNIEIKANSIERRAYNADSRKDSAETSGNNIETGALNIDSSLLEREDLRTTEREDLPFTEREDLPFMASAGDCETVGFQNNIDSEVDNIDSISYKRDDSIDSEVNNIDLKVIRPPAEKEITRRIYDNSSDIYVNAGKITKRIYDNSSDIYVIPEGEETAPRAKETSVHAPGGSQNRIRLDEMKLYAAMNERVLSRSEKVIVESLYRRGEKINSLNMEILLYQFANMIGISNFTVCNSRDRLINCGLFEHFVSVRRSGTFIRLKSSFFYTDNRKIDRYKVFSSVSDRFPFFILCILELLLDGANVNKILLRNLTSFAGKLRRELSVSPGRELVECGALLVAVLKNLVSPEAGIRNISSYLNAVIKKEGSGLVERLTAREVDNGRSFARLLEKIIGGELDELSADDLTFLLNEPVLRSEGAERVYRLLCGALTKLKN